MQDCPVLCVHFVSGRALTKDIHIYSTMYIHYVYLCSAYQPRPVVFARLSGSVLMAAQQQGVLCELVLCVQLAK